ncbi:MAG: hypothetical protein GQ534_10185 [Candidatus Delongbacteria bacterium]|nr:hypothetical protein [Candidatus Delongbacteria bacterium]
MLTRIWTPGNVGSILRAMKNFDFTNMVSINQMNFDKDETLTMCAGAKDHISHLRHSTDFDKECDKCNVIYAFTARKRRFYKIITPEQMAEEISQLPDTSTVGLLFGNETNGITNEEADKCDKLVMIPTSDKYSSLNVASASMIALYEISKKLSNMNVGAKKGNLIDISEKEQLFKVIEKVVSNKLMENSTKKQQIYDNVRHIFRRMNLNKKEAGFVRSIFEIIDNKIN